MAASRERIRLRDGGPEVGRTLRNSGPVSVGAAFGIAFAITMAVAGLLAKSTGGAVVALVSAGLIAVVALRGVRAGVRIEPDWIRIRGVFRSRAVRWSDVDRFSFGPLGIFPAVAIAELRDDRRIPIAAIAAGRRAKAGTVSRANALVGELNRALDAYHRRPH